MPIYRPRKAKHVICNHPGCRVITTGRFCQEHDQPRKAQPRTERDRFLDTQAWRRLSRSKLAETPWCEICLREKGAEIPARHVDHIQPRRDHPELALVRDNLQSLCLTCHSRKTGKGQ